MLVFSHEWRPTVNWTPKRTQYVQAHWKYWTQNTVARTNGHLMNKSEQIPVKKQDWNKSGTGTNHKCFPLKLKVRISNKTCTKTMKNIATVWYAGCRSTSWQLKIQFVPKLHKHPGEKVADCLCAEYKNITFPNDSSALHSPPQGSLFANLSSHDGHEQEFCFSTNQNLGEQHRTWISAVNRTVRHELFCSILPLHCEKFLQSFSTPCRFIRNLPAVLQGWGLRAGRRSCAGIAPGRASPPSPGCHLTSGAGRRRSPSSWAAHRTRSPTGSAWTATGNLKLWNAEWKRRPKYNLKNWVKQALNEPKQVWHNQNTCKGILKVKQSTNKTNLCFQNKKQEHFSVWTQASWTLRSGRWSCGNMCKSGEKISTEKERFAEKQNSELFVEGRF